MSLNISTLSLCFCAAVSRSVHGFRSGSNRFELQIVCPILIASHVVTTHALTHLHACTPPLDLQTNYKVYANVRAPAFDMRPHARHAASTTRGTPKNACPTKVRTQVKLKYARPNAHIRPQQKSSQTFALAEGRLLRDAMQKCG